MSSTTATVRDKALIEEMRRELALVQKETTSENLEKICPEVMKIVNSQGAGARAAWKSLLQHPLIAKVLMTPLKPSERVAARQVMELEENNKVRTMYEFIMSNMEGDLRAVQTLAAESIKAFESINLLFNKKESETRVARWRATSDWTRTSDDGEKEEIEFGVETEQSQTSELNHGEDGAGGAATPLTQPSPPPLPEEDMYDIIAKAQQERKSGTAVDVFDKKYLGSKELQIIVTALENVLLHIYKEESDRNMVKTNVTKALQKFYQSLTNVSVELKEQARIKLTRVTKEPHAKEWRTVTSSTKHSYKML